jgi:hypothetical protein
MPYSKPRQEIEIQAMQKQPLQNIKNEENMIISSDIVLPVLIHEEDKSASLSTDMDSYERKGSTASDDCSDTECENTKEVNRKMAK